MLRKYVRNYLGEHLDVRVRLYHVTILETMIASLLCVLVISTYEFYLPHILLFFSLFLISLLSFIYPISKLPPVYYTVCYSILMNFVIYPLMMLTMGGFHAGNTLWIIYGIVLTYWLLPNRTGFILVVSNLLYILLLLLAYPYYELHIQNFAQPLTLSIFQGVSFLTLSASFCLSIAAQNYMYALAEKETSRKQHKLEQAIQEAKIANLAKSDFLSRMSHDIRTPMNAIVGMNHIAKENIGDPDKVLSCLLKIDSSSNLLLSLINDILDMSRIESGHFELGECDFFISASIQRITEIIQVQCQQKKQTFHVQINSLRHEYVNGDNMRLQQILMNLLSNATKFTPSGGTIELSVNEMPPRIDGYGCYRFIIKDNGIGMTSDFLEHLYLPFERANASMTGNVEGTGLGMSIVRSLVELMHGEITVYSKPGEGTIFAVTLQLRLAEQPNPETVISLNGIRLLLYDNTSARFKHLQPYCSRYHIVLLLAETFDDLRQKLEVARISNTPFYGLLIDDSCYTTQTEDYLNSLQASTSDRIPKIILLHPKPSDFVGTNPLISRVISDRINTSALVQLLFELQNGDVTRPLNKVHPREDLHVLLVEDNEINMEVASAILGSVGMQIDRAWNGEMAVSMFHDSAPNYYSFVFMDVQMPIMNGYEAARRIRSMNREDASLVPIIALTANAFHDDIKKAMDSGMNAHLAKPIDVSELSITLSKYLEFEHNRPFH